MRRLCHPSFTARTVIYKKRASASECLIIHCAAVIDQANMEVELEPRVKALPFKVKAMSRESPSQKALNVLDTDLRNHWSTATNTKEWILLELNVHLSLSLSSSSSFIRLCLKLVLRFLNFTQPPVFLLKFDYRF